MKDFSRFPFPARVVPALTACARGALALAAALSLSGCNLFKPEDVPDVDYSLSVQFSQFVGSTTPAPAAPVTGSWDFAYRYDLGWDGYGYMTLADTGNTASTYGSADGLNGAAPAYRLEIVNLIDGGNFETSAENWSTPGLSVGTATWVSPTSTLFGTGCVKIDLDLGKSQTYTTVARAGFSGFSSTAAYNLFFRYSTKTDTAKVFVDGIECMTPGPKPGEDKGYARYTINNGYASAPVVQFKPLGDSDTLYNFYVDNFRVGRSGNMELRLRLRTIDTVATTGVALDSGTYTFSVWACPDPLATTTQSPYPVDAFVVKMAPTAASELSTTTETYGANAGWQKLTATLKPQALSFVKGTTEPVLDLVLDCNQTRPGSVLLASPSLVYNADGL